MEERSVVIWNPSAGSIDEVDDGTRIRRHLEARPGTVVRETSSGAEAAKLAEAIGKDFDLVVAAGGDGTVNAVVNGLMRAQATPRCGILPLGTANDWCATLAIPDDVLAAIELLNSGEARALDVVELRTPSQRLYFANVATGGNSHRVTESVTHEMKKQWGPLCYVRGAVGVLADLQSYRSSIRFDQEEPLCLDVWNVIIANGRTSAGRLLVAPRANPEDGLLDVVVIKDGTLSDLATLGTQWLISDYLECEQIVYRQVKSLSIQADPSMKFSIDGDLLDEQPVEVRAVPHALSVIVGPDYEPVPAF